MVSRRRMIAGLSAAPLAGLVTMPAVHARTAPMIEFGELFKGTSGLDISRRAVEMAGERVRLSGFVAPHAYAVSDFFVISDQPLGVCPHCRTSAAGPVTRNMMFHVRGGEHFEPDLSPVAVEGTLDVGVRRDSDTGYVSAVRLIDTVVV